jgi:SAM-dependent methyltransferase
VSTDLAATTRTLPSPESILGLATVECRRRVFDTAVEVGVFGALAAGPATATELRERLSLHARYAGDFLDVLVALGLLERTGDRYRNGEAAEAFLDPAKDTYLGEFVEQIAGSFEQAWGQLTTALRTGQVEVQRRGGFLRKSHQDARSRRFIAVMDRLVSRIGEELSPLTDWAAVRDFIDLGGARGHLAAQVKQAQPHVRSRSYDVPDAEEFFDEHIAELGLTGEVGFIGGDLLTDPIPAADVFVYGQVLHGWADPERKVLVRRAYEALRPGGVLMVYDRMIDDDRLDGRRLLYSLYMRLVSPAGSEYRAADCQDWLRAAGFRDVTAKPLLNTHTVVIGRR